MAIQDQFLELMKQKDYVYPPGKLESRNIVCSEYIDLNMFKYDSTKNIKFLSRDTLKLHELVNPNSIPFTGVGFLSLKPGVVFIEKRSYRHFMVVACNKEYFQVVDFDDISFAYYQKGNSGVTGYAFRSYVIEPSELNTEVKYSSDTGKIYYNDKYSFINITTKAKDKPINSNSTYELDFTYLPKYLLKRFKRPTYFELAKNIYNFAKYNGKTYFIDWVSTSGNALINDDTEIDFQVPIKLVILKDRKKFVDHVWITLEELFLNTVLINEDNNLESLLDSEIVILEKDE